MKAPGKRHRWLAAVLAMAAIIVAARLADREPRFEGGKLSAWLDDPTLSAAEIERGVRAMGTNAIPQLQSWLVQKPALLERAVRSVDAKIDYLGIGYHPSLDANFRAMRGFFVLGELAAPAVPWLEAGAARQDADFEFYLKALLLSGPTGWQAFDRLESAISSVAPRPFLNALAFGANRSPEPAVRLARYLEHSDLNTRREAYQTVRLLRARCPASLQAALEARAKAEPDDELRKLAGLFADELAIELAGTGPGDVPGASK
jgi:hypothetical protein